MEKADGHSDFENMAQAQLIHAHAQAYGEGIHADSKGH